MTIVFEENLNQLYFHLEDKLSLIHLKIVF